MDHDGAGDIPGSTSLKVDHLLRSDFGRGDAQTLILVFRSESVDKKPAELSALFDDLKRRLAATRYPDEVEVAGWDYGTSIRFLRRLVEHWRTRFDWRKEEARLNGFRHFIIELNGERVHFLHARADPAGERLAEQFR